MIVRTQEELEGEAARFAHGLEPRSDGATVVALSGPLGAGKTTFTKAIAKELGVEENVTSPTFVIMKMYELVGQAFERLIHIDAYRLKGKHHLDVLGWHELLADSKNLILMEWPEQAEGAVPPRAVRVTFRYDKEGGREIVYGE